VYHIHEQMTRAVKAKEAVADQASAIASCELESASAEKFAPDQTWPARVGALISQVRTGEFSFLASRPAPPAIAGAGKTPRERHHRILWTGLANSGAQVSAMLVGLISLPLTYSYLGQERYGLWIALNAWIQTLAFTDLGIGNGLINGLAESDGLDDREAARRYLSSSFFLLSLIAIVLGALFAVVFRFINWGSFFNVAGQTARDETALTVFLMVMFFLAELPLGIAGRVHLAYQEGYLASIWAIGASLAGLAALLVAVMVKAPLPGLVVALSGSRVLVKAINLVYLFVKRHPSLRPRLACVSAASAKSVLKLGVFYSITNLGFLLEYQVPYIVGPHAIGLEPLAKFGVVHQVCKLAASFPLMFISALWPAYTEAFASGDLNWVRRTLRRSYVLVLVTVVPLVAGLTLFGPFVVRNFLAKDLKTDRTIFLVLGIWAVTRMWREVNTTFLNGATRLIGQASYGTASAILQLSLAFLAGRAWGPLGLACGWIVGFLAISGWLLPLETQMRLKRLGARNRLTA